MSLLSSRGVEKKGNSEEDRGAAESAELEL